MNGSYPILPLGRIEIKTGENKWFNVYGENDIFELWRKENGGEVVIITSSTFNRKEGEVKFFKHDQTGAKLFKGEFIKEMKEEEMKVMNLKSILGYVYK